MLCERMQWQQARQQVLAQNVANADTPNYQAKDLAPHELSADVVKLGPVQTDNSDFLVKHEPGNQAANVQGDVKCPNVNTLVEMTDLRDA